MQSGKLRCSTATVTIEWDEVRAMDSNRTKLLFTGGLQVLTEEDSQGDSTDSLEGFLAANYRFWQCSAPAVELVTNLALYPGITASGRWRSEFDYGITTGISWE
jgi:hypothetical protein